MLGGHLDSWHTATGATDNGAGCAVAMEAVRLIQTLGVKPRRTIRVALWSGEEQDYFGSLGYVTKHFGTPNGSNARPSSGGSRRISISTTAAGGYGASTCKATKPRARSSRPGCARSLSRRNDGDDAEYRRDRSHAVQRGRPARIPVHSGSAELRDAAPTTRASICTKRRCPTTSSRRR